MQSEQTAPIRIIARRDALVAVSKPSGMLVHNSAYAGPAEHTLTDALREQLGCDVWPMHRLDRGTSGVVIFCNDASARPEAMQEVHERAESKRYLAVVRGFLEDVGEITRPVPDEKGVRREARSEIWSFGRASEHYLSLAGVEIFTGRRHQVRRHLRSSRCPVLGDATWGNSRFNREIRAATGFDRMALHAGAITLFAESDSPWTITAPPEGELLRFIEAVFPEDVRHAAYLWTGIELPTSTGVYQ